MIKGEKRKCSQKQIPRETHTKAQQGLSIECVQNTKTQLMHYDKKHGISESGKQGK